MLCVVDEEDANANNMEAEASGSDVEAAEQDDIEQHAPGGRRAGPHASSAAANGHRRDGENNADADGAVCLWPLLSMQSASPAFWLWISQSSVYLPLMPASYWAAGEAGLARHLAGAGY
jgi:hypothetical protein